MRSIGFPRRRKKTRANFARRPKRNADEAKTLRPGQEGQMDKQAAVEVLGSAPSLSPINSPKRRGTRQIY